MKYIKLNKKWVIGLLGFGFSSTLMAADGIEEDYNKIVPVVNPSSKCDLGNIKIPVGMKQYRFLSNEDCSAYFVLPPSINKQSIQVQPSSNLKFCEHISIIDNNIKGIEQDIASIRADIGELSRIKPRSPKEEDRIQKRIESKFNMIDRFTELSESEDKRKFSTYGQREGATFQLIQDSRVLDSDLDRLARENEKIFINNGDNNLPPQYIVRPYFLKAKLNDSIYSFILRNPKNINGESSILSSTIPGLQALVQQSSDLGVAHVKATDVTSAEVRLRLTSVCGGEKETEPGVFELHEQSKFPIFTVNQTYEVQQQFKYAYEATLKVNDVVDQVVKEIITNNNRGFSKAQMFENAMSGNLSSYLKFEWNNGFSVEGHQFTGAMIQEIKNNVFAKFVDDYFEQLVKSGQLEILEPSAVTPANGGLADVDRVGQHCWSKRKWYGRRTSGCYNYTYKVKVWKDGVTNKELKNKLTVDGTYNEIVKVNEMVPLYYTSTFERKKQGDN